MENLNMSEAVYKYHAEGGTFKIKRPKLSFDDWQTMHKHTKPTIRDIQQLNTKTFPPSNNCVLHNILISHNEDYNEDDIFIDFEIKTIEEAETILFRW